MPLNQVCPVLSGDPPIRACWSSCPDWVSPTVRLGEVETISPGSDTRCTIPWIARRSSSCCLSATWSAALRSFLTGLVRTDILKVADAPSTPTQAHSYKAPPPAELLCVVLRCNGDSSN